MISFHFQVVNVHIPQIRDQLFLLLESRKLSEINKEIYDIIGSIILEAVQKIDPKDCLILCVDGVAVRIPVCELIDIGIPPITLDSEYGGAN